MAKHVILQGWFGMNNLGDDLLLHVTLTHLLQTNLDIRVSVIGEGAKRPTFLNKKIRYVPRASRAWGWLRKRWLRSGCDWILCGGSVLADEVLPRFIEPAQMVKSHGGRVFFHALGLRDNLTHNGSLQTLMGLVDRCSMREAYGQQFLSRYMAVDLVGDPVLAMQHAEVVREKRLLIALRGADVSSQHISILKAWVEQLSPHGLSIDILVCFPTQDLVASRQLASALQSTPVRLLLNLNLVEQVESILRAKYILTMRFHPAIIALSAGVVPWMLQPEHKHQVLMEDLEKPSFICKWDGLPTFEEGVVQADATPMKAQGEKALSLLTGWIVNDAN